MKHGRLLMWTRTGREAPHESFSDENGEHWSKPVPRKLVCPLSPASIERSAWNGQPVGHC